ncbi:hypothetical protein E2C01_058919 [Portunus trituberculatus]|uniref:Uncharacterized protein n=1 Tax=Portunus trituberculatus TaxID=210409 RepID=A0A5B7H6Y4_PORTR|nr:hypothetical protein [Portunus trituberculatus]
MFLCSYGGGGDDNAYSMSLGQHWKQLLITSTTTNPATFYHYHPTLSYKRHNQFLLVTQVETVDYK